MTTLRQLFLAHQRQWHRDGLKMVRNSYKVEHKSIEPILKKRKRKMYGNSIKVYTKLLSLDKKRAFAKDPRPAKYVSVIK